MKLAALFSKYLYQHKELRLPGLGIFTLDPSVPIPDSSEKNFNDFTKNIRFSQQPVQHADEDFINFIRTETGKIKPLAESDLDSFLSDGKILLNIGKPFYFEGIGYLQKTREGTYEFTPGEAVMSRTQPAASDGMEETARSRSVFTDDTLQPNKTRRLLIAAGAIAGIVVVVWLGYSLYHRNASQGNRGVDDSAGMVANDRTETAAPAPAPDSILRQGDAAAEISSASSGTGGQYKFVIERTNKARALRRYNQIKEAMTDIRMETRDSTVFSLYFILPASPADTTRIKDSLKVWYARKNVWVEKP